jgi:hypothetical protein
MSVLSLPSQSFGTSSPFDALLQKVVRTGKSGWAALLHGRRNEPRTVEEVRVWARSLAAHQPALAAELMALATRSDA